MTVENTLSQAVAAVIERRRGVSSLSPSWIATEAMRDLDPERKSVEIVYFGCHLQLRQIARQHLGTRYEPRALGGDTHDLFPDLQPRYPAAHSAKSEEPEYVLLEHLTDADVAYNVARLRAEAVTKLAHADALEAWGQDRRLPIPA